MEATVKHVSWGEKIFDYIAQLPRKGKKIMKKLTWPKAKSLLDGHIFRTFCFSNVKQYFVAEKINNLALQDILIFLEFCTMYS